MDDRQLAVTHWIGLIIEQLPDSFDEGVLLSEGFGDNAPVDPSQFQYAILARVADASPVGAVKLVTAAAHSKSLLDAVILTSSAKEVIRSERRIAAKLSPGDVSFKNSFVGFKRNCTAARETAIRVIRMAIEKQWWQFWR